MEDYSADDGLNILTYVGITNLTDEEQNTFRSRWPTFYAYKKDVVNTTWKLYSHILPYVCASKGQDKFTVAQSRDKEFSSKLKESELEMKLKEGYILKEIFNMHPERFGKK